MYDATQHGNQHFYLYAKYWYQKTDQLNDLRRIMAHRCAIAQEHVRPVDIVEVLLEEVERLRCNDVGDSCTQRSPYVIEFTMLYQ